MDFLPLGKLILDASNMNDFEVAKATSRAFIHLNFQVKRSFAGLEAGFNTSSAERITTVVSDCAAKAHFFTWSAV